MSSSAKTKIVAGFTLIELIVVLGIIVLLLAIVLPNYKIGGQQFALQRSANKLAQDIRRVQEMAMSMKEYQCPSGRLEGYLISLVEVVSKKNYYLYARCDGINDFLIETIGFESGVEIQELAYYSNNSWTILGSSAPLYIYFTPPNPNVTIRGDESIERARITLSLESDSAKTRIVKLNKAGLVEME